MRFNVVVGNPPYNNDRYIDFVMAGHKLSSGYSLWITPAKWQNKLDRGKEDDVNGKFRDAITSYMSHVVYYPETRDIFDILNRGGISYYLCSKDKVKTCKVTNISKDCSYFNSSEERVLSGNICLLNFVNRLLDRIDLSDNLSKHIDTDNCPYIFRMRNGRDKKLNEDDLEILSSHGKSYGFIDRNRVHKNIETLDEFKCIMTTKSGGAEIYKSRNKAINGRILGLNTLYKYSPGQICTGDYFKVYSGSESEVDSFISYMSCKLINLLYFAHCCNSNINNLCFDLVPMPDAFDHIFTDKELYAKYNLTDDEIAVIESVIRE